MGDVPIVSIVVPYFFRVRCRILKVSLLKPNILGLLGLRYTINSLVLSREWGNGSL